ncbi:hypothetical protein HYN48_06520 [Flavobacterium magnum]|uniref:Uncharacterized protein n=1 Tax=Flavobacterium magnum TaxID=2162713 RepID=A0A2S0RCT5_9FLAO|nr:hypothetical protein [Flavobacterium magnum]AWA29757.1 hypothetical protein HYN48_06520 [Flavobacterium magnum]
MKQYYFSLLVLMGWCSCCAQAPLPAVNAKIEHIANTSGTLLKDLDHLKTGNYLDALSSFFQMTTKNLTGAQKSIAFNGTLFAIKAEADPSLLIDRNFASETFSRNFQFNFNLNLDENYKYTGFTGGFTYAVINKRDTKIAQFYKSGKYKQLTDAYTALNNDITAATNRYIDSITKIPGIPPTQIAAQIMQVQQGLDTLHQYKKANKFPPGFLPKLNNTLDSAMVKTSRLLADAYDDISKAALLTLSAKGVADDKGKINSGRLGLVFLQGNLFGKRAPAELDIRTTFSYGDTLAVTPMQRTTLRSTLGFNFVLLKSKTVNKSLFEWKVYAELDNVFKNLLPDEQKNTILANSDLRLRITDNLWLPLTIKYDVEKSNFLGFLNISYNFDSVSGNSSGP